jgi:hypothetical protein
MSKKFIPTNDHAYLTWLFALINYIVSKGLSYFGITEEAFNHLKALADNFAEKLAIADEPDTRTKSAVQAKNDARAASEASTRQFINQFLAYNPVVTNADRDNMGLPIHKTKRDPAPVAEHPPYIAVEVYGPRQVRFAFGESATSKAKPDGQRGIEVASVISDTKPAEMDDFTRSAFDTHTPLTLTFKESERGKTLWFAARWENTTGQKGPWSEIQSAIIP